MARKFYLKNLYIDNEEKIIDNCMLYIQDCKKMLDKGFENVADKIKMVGGKQSFELSLNEIEINEIVDYIYYINMQMKMRKMKCTSWPNLKTYKLKK
ncbi:hypothetical protein DWX80_18385 [Ruminococcus sp. AF21-3]|nr:hypothetical protein DWX80_18385 [Ruminococcus sp. AF21-3]